MPPPESLHHADRAKDTLEQLQAERGPVRHWIYWVLWFLIGAALLLLPIAEVDVTVTGYEQLRPEGEQGEVRTAVGGPLERVLVRENQRVERGELMMEIAAPALRRQRQHLAERQKRMEAELEDVRALLTGRDRNSPGWNTGMWAITGALMPTAQ